MLKNVSRLQSGRKTAHLGKAYNVFKEQSDFHLLDNSTRQYTSSSTYPENGHLYITLTSEAFTKFVRSCIETVPYFYILHSPSSEVEVRASLQTTCSTFNMIAMWTKVVSHQAFYEFNIKRAVSQTTIAPAFV